MAPKSRIISIEEWSLLATAHVRNFLSEQLSNLGYPIEFEDICKLWTDRDSEEYIQLIVKDELSDILEWSDPTDVAHPYITKKVIEVPKKLNIYDLDDDVSDVYSFDDLSHPIVTTEDISSNRYVLGDTQHPFRRLKDVGMSIVNEDTGKDMITSSVVDITTGKTIFTKKEIAEGTVFNSAFRDIILHIPTLMDPVDILIRQTLLDIVGDSKWWVIKAHRYHDAILLESTNDYRILWYEEHCDDHKKSEISYSEHLAERVSDNPDIEDINSLMYGPEL